MTLPTVERSWNNHHEFLMNDQPIRIPLKPSNPTADLIQCANKFKRQAECAFQKSTTVAHAYVEFNKLKQYWPLLVQPWGATSENYLPTKRIEAPKILLIVLKLSKGISPRIFLSWPRFVIGYEILQQPNQSIINNFAPSISLQDLGNKIARARFPTHGCGCQSIYALQSDWLPQFSVCCWLAFLARRTLI